MAQPSDTRRRALYAIDLRMLRLIQLAFDSWACRIASCPPAELTRIVFEKPKDGEREAHGDVRIGSAEFRFTVGYRPEKLEAFAPRVPFAPEWFSLLKGKTTTGVLEVAYRMVPDPDRYQADLNERPYIFDRLIREGLRAA